MMKMEELPDFRDVENKLGRKVPESLTRSCTGEAAIRCSETHARADDLHTLNNKIRFLRQQMVVTCAGLNEHIKSRREGLEGHLQAHLRSIDVKLMHQLLSINEGVESMRWLMEERGGVPSRDGSLTGSSFSLSDSQSQHGSDGLDGISVGSYLDTLGEDDPDPDGSVTEEETFTKSALRPRVESDEYYCFR